jgi:hypothetical protein
MEILVETFQPNIIPWLIGSLVMAILLGFIIGIIYENGDIFFLVSVSTLMICLVSFWAISPQPVIKEYSSIEKQQLSENIKVVNYDKDSNGRYIQIAVDYSEVDRVSLISERGKKLDSARFNNGANLKNLYLDKKTGRGTIVSLDKNGDIKEKGSFEIDYWNETSKMGVIY